MHSSMHIWHIAMHASSMAIIDALSMPCIRILARIMVLHMSAQFMHAAHSEVCKMCAQSCQACMDACMAVKDMMMMKMA